MKTSRYPIVNQSAPKQEMPYARVHKISSLSEVNEVDVNLESSQLKIINLAELDKKLHRQALWLGFSQCPVLVAVVQIGLVSRMGPFLVRKPEILRFYCAADKGKKKDSNPPSMHYFVFLLSFRSR